MEGEWVVKTVRSRRVFNAQLCALPGHRNHHVFNVIGANVGTRAATRQNAAVNKEKLK